jgi:hypothetical protein
LVVETGKIRMKIMLVQVDLVVELLLLELLEQERRVKEILAEILVLVMDLQELVVVEEEQVVQEDLLLPFLLVVLVVMVSHHLLQEHQ